MSADRQRRALRLFEEAAELPSGERAAFLEGQCGADAALRQDVDALLEADRQAPASFLGQPALEVAAGLLVDRAAETPALGPGAPVGSYQIVRLLGGGGMGLVYEALDPRLSRSVALKVLPPAYAADPERIQRFEQEARAVSRLNHPNIVSIFEATPTYIATELVAGETLRALIQQGAADAKTVTDVTIQIASALAAAHEAGIIHRDIKPENVMRRPDGIVKVLDFGLAKLMDATQPSLQTRAGQVAGTAHYLSPEQVLGQTAGPRSDLFCLGIVLYELATGVRPFEGPTDGAIFNAILHSAPQPPSRLRPALPAELEGIILRLLEKDPELRFQSASDLRAALRRSQTSGSNTALTPAPARARWPWAWIGATAAALLLGAAVARWMLPPATTASAPGLFSRQSEEAGEDLYPGLSPDGKQLVYASNRRGNWDIYLKRTGGQASVNLTPDSAVTDTTPAFSPDGTRIAFRSDRDGGGIFVMEATGENPRRVASRGYYPAWSPDGQRLVWSTVNFTNPSRRIRGSQLMVTDLATGAERPLPATADAIQPSWSPHGDRVAYWGLVGNTSQRDLFTVPADGSGPAVPVTQDAALDWNPIWSPAGDELFFLSDRGGTMNAWRVGIDEHTGQTRGAPRPFTLPVTYARHLSLAANGGQLAFVRAEERMGLQRFDFDPVAGRAVSPAQPVGDGRAWVASFNLSPDETHIVYDTLGGPEEDLWIMSADGSGRRRLTFDHANNRDPAWSPDGREIAFYTHRESHATNVWLIRPDGGGLRRLTDFVPPLIANGVAWMRGENRRLLVLAQPGAPGWIAREGLTREPAPLPGLGHLTLSFFAPGILEGDEELVTVLDETPRTIAVYSFARQQLGSERVRGYGPAWLPGRRQFLYHRDGKIWLHDRASRADRLVLEGGSNEPWALRVTRNGRRVYFSQSIRQGEIWVARLDASR